MSITIVVGTRPEIIKMAPIIRELKKQNISFNLIHTGQHYDYNMSLQFIKELNLPNPDQSFKLKNKKLHDDLKSILDNFIPAEKELDARKDESWLEIPRKWQKWVEDNYYELSSELTFSPEEFVKELSNSLLWALWRRDEKLARQDFVRIGLAHFFFSDKEKRPKNESQKRFNELQRIAKEEFKPIRDGYDKLQKDLHDLIELKILPRMDETLKELGE